MQIELDVLTELCRTIVARIGGHEPHGEAMFPGADLRETARIVVQTYANHMTWRRRFEGSLEEAGLGDLMGRYCAFAHELQTERHGAVQQIEGLEPSSQIVYTIVG